LLIKGGQGRIWGVTLMLTLVSHCCAVRWPMADSQTFASQEFRPTLAFRPACLCCAQCRLKCRHNLG